MINNMFPSLHSFINYAYMIIFQAKFRCKSEAPLSPTQLKLLCKKAFSSELFKFCNDEFKKGMK